jgi:hypothetical protein
MKHCCIYEHTSFYSILVSTTVIPSSRHQMFVIYFLCQHEMYYPCWLSADWWTLHSHNIMYGKLEDTSYFIHYKFCICCIQWNVVSTIPLYIQFHFKNPALLQLHLLFIWCTNVIEFVHTGSWNEHHDILKFHTPLKWELRLLFSFFNMLLDLEMMSIRTSYRISRELQNTRGVPYKMPPIFLC